MTAAGIIIRFFGVFVASFTITVVAIVVIALLAYKPTPMPERTVIEPPRAVEPAEPVVPQIEQRAPAKERQIRSGN